jgi:hypothetical protein
VRNKFKTADSDFDMIDTLYGVGSDLEKLDKSTPRRLGSHPPPAKKSKWQRIMGTHSGVRRRVVSQLTSCCRFARLSVRIARSPIQRLKRSYTDNGLSTWQSEAPQHGGFAMPLQRGDVQGYDYNRMAVDFTMLNLGKTIPCAISTAAMDDLEGRHDVRAEQRVDQFMRLREVIEEKASRKFFDEQAQANRPVVLRSNDFLK